MQCDWIVIYCWIANYWPIRLGVMTPTLLIGLQTSEPCGSLVCSCMANKMMGRILSHRETFDFCLSLLNLHFPEQVYQGFTWLRRCCAKRRKQVYVFLNEKVVLAEEFLITGLSRLLMLPLVSCEHSSNGQYLDWQRASSYDPAYRYLFVKLFMRFRMRIGADTAQNSVSQTEISATGWEILLYEHGKPPKIARYETTVTDVKMVINLMVLIFSSYLGLGAWRVDNSAKNMM